MAFFVYEKDENMKKKKVNKKTLKWLLQGQTEKHTQVVTRRKEAFNLQRVYFSAHSYRAPPSPKEQKRPLICCSKSY